MAERGEDANAAQVGALIANATVIPEGKLTQYSQGTDWQNYTEQLHFFFFANGITDKNQKRPFSCQTSPQRPIK